MGLNQIVIYNPSSFGGCYDYGMELFQALRKMLPNGGVRLLLPANATFKPPYTHSVLHPDITTVRNKWVKKGHFLWRIFVNPLILMFWLMRQTPSWVVLNDFEQTSAPIWVPLYKLFLRKHRFCVVLHDPDRDAYPPSPAYSAFCMKLIMWVCKIGFYHENLPEKSYYAPKKRTKYVSIPHGIYMSQGFEAAFYADLTKWKGKSHKLISLIGNIRIEKNLNLLIDALSHLPNLKLLVAGREANQNVDIRKFQNQAKDLGVADRIYWHQSYMSQQEMSSVIMASDAVMLYYSKTFTSQSGVLNAIAPFKKKVLVSAGKSGLAKIVSQFKMGLLAEPDNIEALIEGLNLLFNTPDTEFAKGWDSYLGYASWDEAAKAIAKEGKVELIKA